MGGFFRYSSTQVFARALPCTVLLYAFHYFLVGGFFRHSSTSCSSIFMVTTMYHVLYFYVQRHPCIPLPLLLTFIHPLSVQVFPRSPVYVLCTWHFNVSNAWWWSRAIFATKNLFTPKAVSTQKWEAFLAFTSGSDSM